MKVRMIRNNFWEERKKERKKERNKERKKERKNLVPCEMFQNSKQTMATDEWEQEMKEKNEIIKKLKVNEEV